MPQSLYLPILELRPAEMLALGELPNKDKDAVVPLFRLRPWGASLQLEKSIERLHRSFGTRRAFLEVGEAEYVEPSKRRPVHASLDQLRSPQDGYRQWYEYLRAEKHAHFIPSVQTGGPLQDFYAQIERLYSLDRGLLMRLDSPTELAMSAAAQAVAQRTNGGVGVTLVLDYGKQDARFIAMEPAIKSLITIASDACKKATIAVSASSFPDGFTSITKQEIYERALFDRLKKASVDALMYSDRGGARAEKQLGGGGLPAPRIDYAKKTSWHFYRQDIPLLTAFDGYQAQAIAVMNDQTVWDKGLKLWACQMIEKTAAGDSEGGISSPNRSTAARINLHLHRQIFYDDEVSFMDTDEAWTD